MRHLLSQNRLFLVLGACIGALTLVVLVVQLFYPDERTLPFASVGGVDVGNKTYAEVVDVLRARHASVPLQLNIDGEKLLNTTSAHAGVTPDYDSAARAVTNYNTHARWVPFSIIYKMAVNRVSLGFVLEEERFDEFAKKVLAQCETPPQNAELQLDAGRISVKPEVAGRRCSRDVLRAAVERVSLSASGVQVNVASKPLQPTYTKARLGAMRDRANAVLSKGLTIGAPDKQWVVGTPELASWLKIEGKDELRIGLDSERVGAYLKKLDSELVIETTTTTVTLQDGVEITRQNGRSGRIVDTTATIARIKDRLFANSSSSDSIAWVAFKAVNSPIKTVRTYSETSRGVQALVEQWDKEHNGRYGIMVRDMSGRDLNASLNADQDFVTASTYKMFLAYATFHAIEDGKLKATDRTSTGLSVQACIDEMILHSTNECAVALMDKVGWGQVHRFIKSQFPSTSLDNGASADGEKHTTVRDEVTFLQRLYSGSLDMSRTHHNYLLGLMKRQVYRSGIPAGVPGISVANKVGFYAGYKHDVAIIYGSKGVYLVGIMSYGGADWEFADLSRKVADLLQ